MHTSSSLNGYGAIYTWKDNDTTGRVLGHTGHPEGNSSEDKKKYISASMLLLADGLGKPGIKHTLKNLRDAEKKRRLFEEWKSIAAIEIDDKLLGKYDPFFSR